MPDETFPKATSDIERLEIEAPTFSSETQKLFDRTGFLDSEELREATDTIVACLLNPDSDESATRFAWIELSKVTEGIVDERDGGNQGKAMIAAIIHKALIFKLANRQTRYLMELDLAEVYASNTGESQLGDAVEAEIEESLESLEMSPEVLIIKLRGYISEIDREHLRDMYFNGDDFQDIRGDAYAALVEEGEDPDEVLAAIGA